MSKFITDMSARERGRYIQQLESTKMFVDLMVEALKEDGEGDVKLIAPAFALSTIFPGVMQELLDILGKAQFVDLDDLDRPMPMEGEEDS